jgi:hypothetical protein
MKFNLAALATLTVVLASAPMIASADATTTGSYSTLSSLSPVSYHGAHYRHHRHHRHRRHRMDATAAL